jgi:hypothetical protein
MVVLGQYVLYVHCYVPAYMGWFTDVNFLCSKQRKCIYVEGMQM